MTELDARRRARLPNSAFAYVDSKGRRRLPINDAAHVRNALSRFNQVTFEDDAAQERARRRLLNAAKKYGIVPIGFVTRQLSSQRSEAAAGQLVIEFEQVGSAGALESRLRSLLRDSSLVVVHWSDSLRGYLNGDGRRVELPSDGEGRAVTLLERNGRPLAALLHDPSILKAPDLVKTVTAAVRLAIENERLQDQIEARASDIRTLPSGHVTFLLTDIEDSTGLLRQLGDEYASLLADVRGILRGVLRRTKGREVDARADELFAAFEHAPSAIEAALAIQRAMRDRTWPRGVPVRLRIGVHSGQPTLTETGYVGLPVHTAARVCAAAHGGQVLLSGAAVEAVGADLPHNAELRALGGHALRGLPGRQALFQVGAADIPAEFPPPRVGLAPQRRA